MAKSKKSVEDPMVAYVKARAVELGPASMAARMASKPVDEWPSGYRESISLAVGHPPVAEPEAD